MHEKKDDDEDEGPVAPPEEPVASEETIDLPGRGPDVEPAVDETPPAPEKPKQKRGRRPSAKKAADQVAAVRTSGMPPSFEETAAPEREVSLTKIPSKHRKFAKGT